MLQNSKQLVYNKQRLTKKTKEIENWEILYIY